MTTDTAKALAPDGRSDRAKRAQIIDGARRMFLAQGFDAASMGAIAREAGVSKGTLYVYSKARRSCSRRLSRTSAGLKPSRFSRSIGRPRSPASCSGLGKN